MNVINLGGYMDENDGPTFIRELDTITEVSENSYSVVSRGQDDDCVSLPAYADFVWTPGSKEIDRDKSHIFSVRITNDGKGDSGGSNGGTSFVFSGPQTASTISNGDLNVDLEKERERRLLLAYQLYHQSKEAVDGVSLTSSMSSTSSGPFLVAPENGTVYDQMETVAKDNSECNNTQQCRSESTGCLPWSYLRLGRQNCQISNGMDDVKIVTVNHPRSSSLSPLWKDRTGHGKEGQLGAFPPLYRSDSGDNSTRPTPVCTVKAYSQVIFNNNHTTKSTFFSPSLVSPRKILAEATVKIHHSNPYLALAKATLEAAAQAVEEWRENSCKEDGTISVTVNSVLTTKKENLIRDNAASKPENGIEKVKKLDMDENFRQSSNFYSGIRNSHPERREEAGYAQNDETPVFGINKRNPLTDTNADALSAFLTSENLRRVLGTGRHDQNGHNISLNEPSSMATFNESIEISSTVMNETTLSVNSNDSNGSRPTSKNSWRFWDKKMTKNECNGNGNEENKMGRFIKYKPKITSDRGRSKMGQFSTCTLPPSPAPPAPPIRSASFQNYQEYAGPQFKLRPIQHESIGSPRVPTSRAASTGFLEIEATAQRGINRKSIMETDLDVVQREMETGEKRGVQLARDRAKSAERIFDKVLKMEIEPPENELQKKLGLSDGKDGKTLSEHELRFRKSMDKLHVPDWYLNSKYFRGTVSKSPDMRNGEKVERVRSERGSPEWKNGFVESNGGPNIKPSSGKMSDQKSTTENRGRPRNREESGKLTIENGYSDQYRPTNREESNSIKNEFNLPRNFFEKYKQEIEDLRQSRPNLNQSAPVERSIPIIISEQHQQRRPIPIATVRPTQMADFPGSPISRINWNRPELLEEYEENWRNYREWSTPNDWRNETKFEPDYQNIDFLDQSAQSSTIDGSPGPNGTPTNGRGIKSRLKAVQQAIADKVHAFDRYQITRRGSRRVNGQSNGKHNWRNGTDDTDLEEGTLV